MYNAQQQRMKPRRPSFFFRTKQKPREISLANEITNRYKYRGSQENPAAEARTTEEPAGAGV